MNVYISQTQWVTSCILKHYSDVIISAIACQITGVSIACWIVCSGADQKKISKFHANGLCDWKPLLTVGFPSQRANSAEIVSIWWRHHDNISIYIYIQWFLNTGATQVMEIPCGREWSVFRLSCLLMAWRRKEPVHQKPWYGPSFPGMLQSQHLKVFIYLFVHLFIYSFIYLLFIYSFILHYWTVLS